MFKITLTLFSIPLLATAVKIFWKAYKVSPLYPIKNPKFGLFMFTFNPVFTVSIEYSASFWTFSKNSFKNFLTFSLAFSCSSVDNSISFFSFLT